LEEGVHGFSPLRFLLAMPDEVGFALEAAKVQPAAPSEDVLAHQSPLGAVA